MFYKVNGHKWFLLWCRIHCGNLRNLMKTLDCTNPLRSLQLFRKENPLFCVVTGSHTLTLGGCGTVTCTEYTQTGNGHFLASIPSWWKIQPSLVWVGGARRPSVTVQYIRCCSVRSSWEGRYTPPISTQYGPLPRPNNISAAGVRYLRVLFKL